MPRPSPMRRKMMRSMMRWTAKLKGRAGIVLDVHGGLLGFQEKLPSAADAKAIVRRFGPLADFDGVLVDNVLVGFGVALFVVHVPTERLEERVEELMTKLRFV